MALVALKILSIWTAVSLASGAAWIAVVLTADAFSDAGRSSRLHDVRPVTR